MRVLKFKRKDGTWGRIGGEAKDGQPGKAVVLRTADGYIQWQYEGDAAWINLIALDDLKGEPGTGTPGRGVSSIAWDAEQSAWIATYTDDTTENIGGPDLSGYKPQRIETTEPADTDIAEGEIVWIGEVVE